MTSHENRLAPGLIQGNASKTMDGESLRCSLKVSANWLPSNSRGVLSTARHPAGLQGIVH